MDNKYLLSIVTVCYNAAKTISSTIESVLSQDVNNVEYLILDGKSNDNTLSIVNGYAAQFKQKGIDINIVSEEDSGIYDAMNKAAKIAKGKYVLYLNADDKLCNENVLSKVIEEIESEECDVYYGDMISFSRGLYRYAKAKNVEYFKTSMPFCHQCVFTRRTILCKHPYDLNFKLFADHDFYLWCFLNGKKFKQMNFPISIYYSGGFSAKAGFLKQKTEHYGIHLKNGLISEEKYNEVLKAIKKKAFYHDLINFVRKNIPVFVVKCFGKKYLKQNGYSFDVQTAIKNGKNK